MMQNTCNIVLMDKQIIISDEPPLLEELGLNFGHIKKKTISVLNPLTRKLDPELLDDCDLAGPLVFGGLLGFALTLSGKWTFDYIYGFVSVGSISICILVNLMSPPGGGIDMYRTVSILGYCLLPIVLLAFISIVLSLNSVAGSIVSVLCLIWSTSSSSMMFSSINSEDQKLLFAYPLALYYTCFALLAIF